MTLHLARRVLQIESEAIKSLSERLNDNFGQAVKFLLSVSGRVVVTGMGKSGIVCRKIASTLNSTGTPSQYLNPAEAVHGDMGMIAMEDVVIAISNSGRTREVLQLIDPIKRLSIPLIAIVGDMDSVLASEADVVIDASVAEEACPIGLAPTASTTAALALGDALAMAVLEQKGFTESDFRVLHPRGQLGFKLVRVEDIMHAGSEIPKVKTSAILQDVLSEISDKKLGMTTVLNHSEQLQGVITDGDLRRQLQQTNEPYSIEAHRYMTPNPITIRSNEAAATALAIMEQSKITSLVVLGKDLSVIGVIHIHDLWRLGKYF